MAVCGPMKFTEGPDGDETKQSSVKQKKLNLKIKAENNSNSRIIIMTYFPHNLLRDENFTGILSC